ncbi:MAG: S-layer homology domain-containing protein [Clostridia bacterium]|nr:S-layer homology domain-containing protein [Clostridia bacterium]
MMKKIMFACILALMLCVSAAARLSPAMDIIEKRLENRPCATMGNLSPEAGEMDVTTQRGIAVFKSFSAADPDGNELSFEVVKYPAHGSVEITNDGQFIYRPLSGYTGNDSFEYRAVDVYGSASEEKTVEIKVSRPAADIYFDDMKDHWAHNAAIKMASTGLMTGKKDGEKLLFEPEEDMTRGDFLALSLIMSGHEADIPFASKTVFADDSQIPQNIKSYVQYAYDKGIVSGYENVDSSINFESAGAVTRAEAALIVSRILALSEENETVMSYKDAGEIPAWASGAVASLSEIGILSGNADGEFSADRNMTRAEGAEIICNVADYVEDKKREEKKKEKNLFNLFGLLG